MGISKTEHVRKGVGLMFELDKVQLGAHPFASYVPNKVFLVHDN